MSILLSVFATCVAAVGPESVPAASNIAAYRLGSEVYVHGEVRGDGERRLESVKVNGAAPTAWQVGWFPIPDGRAFCARGPAKESPAGAVPPLTLCWADGRVTEVPGGPSVPWVVARSQHDFPFRVVDCETRDRGVVLTVYNESDETKPDATILSVRVNGRDRTAECRLPAGPVPADRQRYLADQRRVEIPADWSAKGEMRVTLDYQLGPPRFPQRVKQSPPRSGSGPRSVTVDVRRGLRYPVGVGEGPTLTGCVCVHHGDLRPDVDEQSMRRRLLHVRRAAADLPVYLRGASLTPAAVVARQAEGYDLAIVAQPLLDVDEQGWSTSDPFARACPLVAAGVPFVASLFCARTDGFDDRDFFWWLVSLLGEGSHGLDWTDTEGVDRSLWSTWLRAQGQWLSGGRCVPLDVDVSARNIRASAWVCGPSELAVMVTNRWCSLAPGQARKPFSAIPRRAVAVTVAAGPSFTDGALAAEWRDAGGTRPLAAEVVGRGRVRVEVPTFETGGILRLRSGFDITPAGQIPAVAAVPARGLEPSGPPFVRLGRVQVGRRVPVTLTVSNPTGATRTVRVELAPAGTVPAASADFPETLVGPHSEAKLVGMWTVPTGVGTSLGAVRVRAAGGDEADGFVAFLECEAVQDFAAEPGAVDLGTTPLDGTPVERSVRLSWRGTPASIRSVTLDPPDPRLSVTPSGDVGLRVRFVPNQPGPLKTRARIELAESSTERFDILINAQVEDAVQVHPSRIVVTGSVPVRRSLYVEAVEPVRVEVEGATPHGFSVSGPSGEWSSRHRVDFECQPVAVDDERSSLTLLCQPRRGDPVRLVIPVTRLGVSGGAGEPMATGPEVPLAAEARVARAERLVRRFRADSLPADCPNWVLAHALLPYAPAASRTPGESAEFARRLALLLRSPDAEGRNGCVTTYRDKPALLQGSRRLFDHQHHPSQFLHYLAMLGVPPETPLNVPGRSWTLADLLRAWVPTAKTTGDLSWVTSALLEYQTPSRPWNDTYGRPRRLSEFVAALRAKPEDYCDESHWMTSLARIAADERWQSDPSFAAERREVASLVAGRVSRLRKNQRPDGALVLDLDLSKRDKRSEKDSVIHYTGHHLEWLTIALTTEELRGDWVTRSVDRLMNAVEDRYPDGRYLSRLESDEECFTAGFLAHALSGVSRWRFQVAPAEDTARKEATPGKATGRQ